MDPCGEKGEFHSFAYKGPMFSAPIAIEAGITVERDGFVFADLELAKRVAGYSSVPADGCLSEPHHLLDRRDD